jgi:hypothetical protein
MNYSVSLPATICPAYFEEIIPKNDFNSGNASGG